MSSKGYVRISENQLRLERETKKKHKTWHQHIMNLLLAKNVCGSCLRIEDELVHWDAKFVLLRDEDDIGSSLKDIMMSTFGPTIIDIIPTGNFCQKCVDSILSAHLLILQLRNNCSEIQKKLAEISQQMKWTNYLNEHGSLVEIVSDKNLDEYNLNTKPKNNLNDSNDVEKNIKTHRIELNNESLTKRFLREPDMHKFLFVKQKVLRAKLPKGITVKKVTKTEEKVDTDFAPHDLLELNWDDDDDLPLISVQDKKLQSNENLIMNLMEEAKTVEKHKHFHDNLKLRVNQSPPEIIHTLKDSLSVKLIQNNMTQAESTDVNQNHSDCEEVVPQDLLELKWPEDTAQQTKIPVKKLNFNEALTVKYIPGHKPHRDEDVADELAPHELLELNWKEDDEVQNDEAPQTNQKHSIDLTQWLQDQGMSTIKTKGTPENSKVNNLNDETDEPALKKTKSDNRTQEENSENLKYQIIQTNNREENSENLTYEIIETSHKTISGSQDCTIKKIVVMKEPEDIIRCALCDLSFIQYESYSSHYKLHKISETAKCYRCTGKFPVIELLVEHLLFIHSEDMAYCTLCYALLKQHKVAKHMVDYHAKKVEVINADSTILAKDGSCKKCNQFIKTPSNTPHICVFRLDCIECTDDCIHEKYLKSYIEQIKDNKIIFKCADCDYQYKTKRDIIKHANFMHLKHKSHQCVVCRERFATQNDLSTHNNQSHHPCGRCKKVFADKEILECHNCLKQYWTDTKCESCGQKFLSKKTYDYHINTASVVSNDCGICKDKVPDRCNMARHMQFVHQVSLKKTDEAILYECTICRRMYKTVPEFKQHGCLFECKICGKRFSNSLLYGKHLQAHKGVGVPNVIKCSICTFETTCKKSFAQHMTTHGDHRQCPTCFNYVEKKFLKQHLENHDDPKNNLKCPHCSVVCENPNQFEVHVNRFHLLQRPYECDTCKKCFYSKHRLRDHIKTHCSVSRTEKCTLCSKRFARKHTLEKHMKLHSIGQLYNCDLCEKKYISVALLNQHRVSHSQTKNTDVSRAESSQSNRK